MLKSALCPGANDFLHDAYCIFCFIFFQTLLVFVDSCKSLILYFTVLFIKILFLNYTTAIYLFIVRIIILLLELDGTNLVLF